MATVYDRAEIYDLMETPEYTGWMRTHWQTLFSGRGIDSFLDVSIGSGGVTLPAAEFVPELAGSDLSGQMLARCGEKAAAHGIPIELHEADFRALDQVFAGRQFGCVGATGNALAYVENREIPGVLRQMDALVRPGGWLYLDQRNWDRILKTRQRFYFYPPHFVEDTRVNLLQVWDYLTDGSMDFNLLYTFERENRIVQKEVFVEHYHPLPLQLVADTLAQLGYAAPELQPFPARPGAAFDAEKTPWYCLMARKPA